MQSYNSLIFANGSSRNEWIKGSDIDMIFMLITYIIIITKWKERFAQMFVGPCNCQSKTFLCSIIWISLIFRESSDNTVATSRSLPSSRAQPIFYWCCGAALCSKNPVWALWIHKGLSLQLAVKYCNVMNHLSSTTVKGAATIAVNLWINLFCSLQAWMETPTSVWSGLFFFVSAVVGGAHAKTGLRSKSILLNSNPVQDPLIWILSFRILFMLAYQIFWSVW